MDAYDALMRDGFVVVRQAIAPALVRDINERISRFKQRNQRRSRATWTTTSACIGSSTCTWRWMR